MKLLSYITQFFFPKRCITCNVLTGGSEFCEKCLPEIPFLDEPTCEKCGIPLSPEFPSPICARCRERDFRFDKNIPLVEYKGLGKTAVLNMKYDNPRVIPDIAKLMAEKIKESGENIDIVTFVPTTKKEEGEKGIIVTMELSKKVAKNLSVPFSEMLCKVRKTEKQKELTQKQRIINVRGAYRAKKSGMGQTVLLIDDVFTTGATMDECTKVLKRAGAERVITATLGIRDRE